MDTVKKKVIIVQRIFTNYREPVFDEINKKYNLLVLHSKDNSGIKQVVTKYSKLVKKIRFGSDSRLFLFMFKDILKFKPAVIIHEFSMGIFSLVLIYFLTRFFKIKLILWSHGYNRKKGFHPDKSFSDKLRLMYARLADALLLYGDKDKEIFSKYIGEKKIFVAKNTFDTEKLIEIYNKYNKIGRDKIKKKLGFIHKYNLIYIGRMIDSKKPEILIDIYEKIKSKLKNNIAVHFIGDGESKAKIETLIKAKGYKKNFYFHGSVYEDEKIGELLFPSDVMVMPGECGLSVVHSFCFMLPVITFISDNKGPFHGPEIEYIQNDKTGFLIERNNIDLMSKIIIDYLLDKKKQKLIKNNIKKLILNELSIKNMIKGFDESIDFCLKNYI